MVEKNDSVTDDLENASGVRLGGEPVSSSLLTLPPQKKESPQNKLLSSVGPFNRQVAAGSAKKEHKEMESAIFGYELIMDLEECDLTVMRSKKKLTEYVNKLCRLIKMKKYGKVRLPYFGLEKPHTKGYSLLQFIETSSITGHFSEYWRKSYINIFSCKQYDHVLAQKFTKDFLKAKSLKSRFLVR